jgi:hypothetical protein
MFCARSALAFTPDLPSRVTAKVVSDSDDDAVDSEASSVASGVAEEGEEESKDSKDAKEKQPKKKATKWKREEDVILLTAMVGVVEKLGKPSQQAKKADKLDYRWDRIAAQFNGDNAKQRDGKQCHNRYKALLKLLKVSQTQLKMFLCWHGFEFVSTCVCVEAIVATAESEWQQTVRETVFAEMVELNKNSPEVLKNLTDHVITSDWSAPICIEPCVVCSVRT